MCNTELNVLRKNCLRKSDVFRLKEIQFVMSLKIWRSMSTGIIPFSRLAGFYANLGSEIFFATKERGPQYK